MSIVTRWLLERRKRKHGKEHRIETCDNCKHIYYNSDGSASCDSPFEKACLQSDCRMFKEHLHRERTVDTNSV